MKFFALPASLSAIVALFLTLFVCCSQASEEKAIVLKSIQADFIQEKHLKILVRPLVSTGTFTFQTPQSLRWEYLAPVPSVLIMHGDKIKKFVERDGQMVEDKGLRLDSMLVVLGQISNWLDGRFSDNDMFTVSFSDDTTVQLSPKDQGLAGFISKIELKLAAEKGFLDGVTIFEGPDSYTTMTFENRAMNMDVPLSVFTQR
ncbi:outer membrane lipoprotein carrier protein LolA [Desulforhopalus sp. 52FAK]